jgi:hypothetical protein
MTESPTSAQHLAAHFEARGVAPDALRGRHLAQLYAKLRVHPDRADFARAAPLLGALAVGGMWGTDPFAVIVETRDTPALAFVIANVHAQTGLAVQLFHSAANRTVLDDPRVQALIAEGAFCAVELATTQLDAGLYNALFLDRRFYDALAGRGRFLVFQTDALCCAGADFTLSDFDDYAYVGAHWPTRRPIGLVLHGGCGGFSRRDWDSATTVLGRFAPDAWPGGEDGYFAFHTEVAGMRVAPPHVMAQFATQSDFQFKSFGAHQVNLLPPGAHAQFLAYCPAVRNVLSWDRNSAK